MGRVGSQKAHKLTDRVGSGHGFRGSGRVGSGNLDPRATPIGKQRAMQLDASHIVDAFAQVIKTRKRKFDDHCRRTGRERLH